MTEITDYELLADRCSAALVSDDGSIDWLCLPRHDSPAIFGRLVDEDAGHWSIRPAAAFGSTQRYLSGTLVLETTFTTVGGVVRLTDAMAIADGRDSAHEVLRSVAGVTGEVELIMELDPRTADPNRIAVRAGVCGEIDETTTYSFTVRAGDRVGFSLCWIPLDPRVVVEPTLPAAVAAKIEDTVWRSWAVGHDVSAGTHRRLVGLNAHLLERTEVRELVDASR